MKTTQLSKNKINVNKYPKTKKYVNLYFHAHQPYRLSNYSIFDIGTDKYYFWGPEGQTNSEILDRVSNIGYLKANDLMLELIKTSGLKVSYSLSGVLLEQFEEFEPWMVDKFQEMIDTSKVELIGETYYHSLAFFYSKSEFARHVNKHREIIWRLFRERPQVFRNTELTYRNDVGEFVREMGFKGIYAEGWDPILGWRSPNYIYKGKHVEFTPEEKETARSQKQGRVLKDIKLLLKNYRRSDDIAFRFQLKRWEGYPVTADKFAHWIDEEDGELINLCMDYETIGEHHREDSGIFEFYRHLPSELAKKGVEFVTASEALQVSKGGTNDEVDFPYIVSWADHERDLSAWMGNK
ncbi:MAG TPA: glycoside hydrolase family 57 protein, partial [Candidatus Dojkabacteria bacterium]